MAVKIRLSRKGRKKMPIYDIVVADARAPRDGKFIEKLGQYNPHSTPAILSLNADRALYWLQVGAQPTDTTRKILSVNGVMFKKHLQIGVTKGAITQEVADERFAAWLQGKEEARNQKIANLSSAKDAKKSEGLELERKKKEEKLAAIKKAEADMIAAANAAEKAQESAANAAEETVVAETAEVAAEETATEVVAETITEVVAEETPAEVVAETVSEVVAETPAAEEAAAPDAE